MNARDEMRIRNLERRIRTLEQLLGVEPGTKIPSKNSVTESSMNQGDGQKTTVETNALTRNEPISQTSTRYGNEEMASPFEGTTRQAPPTTDWEMQFGKVWMPRIFIIVLLVGVIWGFTAAVQAGWINQPVRIALGYAAFVALMIYGEFQLKRQRAALGQVLQGGATALAVLTTFAASTLYELIGPTPGFLLEVLFVIAGVYFSFRHRSEALAVVSTVAAVLVPFLIKSQHPNLTVFIAYEAVASFAFTFYGLKGRYLYLTIIASVVLHFSFLTLIDLKGVQARGFVVPVIIQTLALFSLTLYAEKKSMLQKYKVTLLSMAWSSLGFTTIWVYVELSAAPTHTYLWGMTALLLVGSIWSWRAQKSTLLLSAVPFWPYLSLAAFGVMSNSQFYWMFVFIAAAAVIVSSKLRTPALQIEGNVLFGLAGLVLFAVYDPFVGHRAKGVEHLTWGLYTALTLIVVYAFIPKAQPRLKTWAIWFGIVVLGLFLTHESQVMTYSLSQNTQHMVLSFVWILYAIAAIVYGVFYGHIAYRRFGIIFLFITLSKLVLIDIPAVTLFVRAILFIAIGAVGVLISRLFYKKRSP